MSISHKSFKYLVALLVYCNQLSAQPFVDLFSEQKIIYSSSQEKADYKIALSALKKINGEWVAEKEQRIQASVVRKTFEMEGSYSLGDTQRKIERFFTGMKATQLYKCSNWDCGSSSAWANVYFKVKQLYGLDKSQHYWVWKLTYDSKAPEYISVYSVQRGNKRVYVQIEIATPVESTAEIPASSDSIVLAFREHGFYTVSGLKKEGQNMVVVNSHLRALIVALNTMPESEFYIVGHDYDLGTLAEQISRSENYARQVFQRLTKLGVNSKRLTVKGLGPLAPGRSVGQARVEIVIRKK